MLINNYLGVEVSEIKYRKDNASKRAGFRSKLVKKESYATVTLFDRTHSLTRPIVKTIILNNPHIEFLQMIIQDKSIWNVSKQPVSIKVVVGDEVEDRQINLSVVELRGYNGEFQEMTHPIPVQIKNLKNTLDIRAYSLDGTSWLPVE